jgi:guanylate kinase
VLVSRDRISHGKPGSQEYQEEKKSPLCRYHIVNHHLDNATDELVTIIKSCLLN